MPVINKDNIVSFFNRVYTKVSFTLEPINKGGKEILNSSQIWEILNYSLINRGQISIELSKPDRYGVLFPKETTGLQFSFVIVPNANAEIELIILSNQKLSNGTKSKRIGLLGSGNKKDVKYGVRVDTRVSESRAVMKIELCPVDANQEALANANNYLKAIKIEAERPYKYDSPNIIKNFMGPCYTHVIPVDEYGIKARIADYDRRERSKFPTKKYHAVLMFAPESGNNLTYLYKNILTDSERLQIATEKDQGDFPVILIKLLKDILHGFSAIHLAGDIHGDVGCDNILVQRNVQDGTLSAAVIDFELATESSLQRYDLNSISGIVFEMLRDFPDLETLNDEGVSDITEQEQAYLRIKYPILEKFATENESQIYSCKQLLDELKDLQARQDSPRSRYAYSPS